ncbi:UNVERIFIED_CONTAM: putative mitochondrial protein [Sesamum radiatum]|uniref:Mitochondrial protein n=1 Tax=Sesamum radiatum TaxID=300843 RepID=A0AAW2VPF2_SESRA
MANGQWLEEPGDIRNHIESYFREVFRSRNPSEDELERGTEAISERVTEQMRQEILKPYTADEVTTALSQMAPLKSPGPDGMLPFFFQTYWHIVKNDVVSNTLLLLNNLILPSDLNHTNIVLIPKCKNPETLSYFHPISLCNVAYKIASKTIANRLKPLLDAIISPSQAAFVPGRLITDNVLLAFEVNHYLKTKRWGTKGHMALKLDISKAYDKVEWNFLQKVLVRLEAFSALLQQAEQRGNLQGVAVCRQAPRVSHLLFADDTLIFCQASGILEVLTTFGRAAGQEINFEKSSVVFSTNTAASLKVEIQRVLQVRVEARHDLYLGLPSVVGKSRRSVFQSIRDRIWRRISGWNERTLSQAGKEVLIKAVAQAIPTYAMGCFRLPVSLIKEIQSMISNFWWHNGEARNIHWISWHRLYTPKARGGLGFRDLQAFNLAMLSKQIWRIITNPSSLLSSVLRARYFPHGQILTAVPGRNTSYPWRSILAAQQVVHGGFRWHVGSGRSIQIWDDPWIPRPSTFRVLTPNEGDVAQWRVCDLIVPETKEWNYPLVREILWPVDADLILALPLSAIDGEDLLPGTTPQMANSPCGVLTTLLSL